MNYNRLSVNFLKSSHKDRVIDEVMNWQEATFSGKQSDESKALKLREELGETRKALKYAEKVTLIEIASLLWTLLVLFELIIGSNVFLSSLPLLGLLLISNVALGKIRKIAVEEFKEEVADCYFMLISLGKEQNVFPISTSLDFDVVLEIEKKLIKNKRRTWNKDDKGVFNHVV